LALPGTMTNAAEKRGSPSPLMALASNRLGNEMRTFSILTMDMRITPCRGWKEFGEARLHHVDGVVDGDAALARVGNLRGEHEQVARRRRKLVAPVSGDGARRIRDVVKRRSGAFTPGPRAFGNGR
jgi:hypothetical protein